LNIFFISRTKFTTHSRLIKLFLLTNKTTGRIVFGMVIAKKQINKGNLLSQGIQLLMQQGYHGTGLKEILDAVQVPKGSFYNYFTSKESYAAQVIQHYIDPFIAQLESHLKNPDHDGLTALSKYFNELIQELEKAEFKGGCLLGNLMGEIGDTSELCQKSLQLAVHRYHSVLAKALIKAQMEGSVRTDKSAEDMADLLVNTWQGALLRMKIEQSVEPLNQCRHDLLEDYFKK
jgi:TetR/AcrR family transcriptional regulator, transcriptional repressor for nem operon